jgi:hypothetical protein
LCSDKFGLRVHLRDGKLYRRCCGSTRSYFNSGTIADNRAAFDSGLPVAPGEYSFCGSANGGFFKGVLFSSSVCSSQYGTVALMICEEAGAAIGFSGSFFAALCR